MVGDKMNIDKDTLKLFMDDAVSEGDEASVILLTALIESYDTIDRISAQKASLTNASNRLISASKEKDTTIQELHKLISDQENLLSNSVASFRKLFNILMHGNKLFNAEPLLRLWGSIEKLLSSKSQDELAENNILVMSILSELNSDKILMDMRSNMINFKRYMAETDGKKDDGSGIEDTTGDND